MLEFDAYAKEAFDEQLHILGEPIIIVASDDRFPEVNTMALVSKRQKNFDSEGFETINSSLAVRINIEEFLEETGFQLGMDDYVFFENDDEETKYRIIDEKLDASLTSKFFLQVTE